jgi:hypothetical protein
MHVVPRAGAGALTLPTRPPLTFAGADQPGYLSSRESRRSFNTRSSVWQWGQ